MYDPVITKVFKIQGLKSNLPYERDAEKTPKIGNYTTVKKISLIE